MSDVYYTLTRCLNIYVLNNFKTNGFNQVSLIDIKQQKPFA
jgi:hypothetical protein